ncbi:tyrosine-type recombinase/integrase [Brevibacillus laterosporus]|uniref:tyrosine-type recombinase/integrase n=1 Tax=Brevibacillus laterosporus TaxID=1465 RepID=UPI003CC7C576
MCGGSCPLALRHTHAVHLLESGANIKYVSERLGHASVKVTADTYLHVTKKIEDSLICLNWESNLSTHPQADSITPLPSFVSFHQLIVRA